MHIINTISLLHAFRDKQSTGNDMFNCQHLHDVQQ